MTVTSKRFLCRAKEYTHRRVSGGSLPEANRHYAARAQEALDAVLIAPIA